MARESFINLKVTGSLAFFILFMSDTDKRHPCYVCLNKQAVGLLRIEIKNPDDRVSGPVMLEAPACRQCFEESILHVHRRRDWNLEPRISEEN